MFEINRNPTARDLKWFGAALATLFAAVGSLAYFKFGSTLAATIIWSVGAGTMLLYALAAPVRRPIYIVWMTLTAPVGRLIGTIALAIVYYLIMTPIGLLLRLRRDPMNRRLDRSVAGYWEPHRQTTEKSRYFRQF